MFYFLSCRKPIRLQRLNEHVYLMRTSGRSSGQWKEKYGTLMDKFNAKPVCLKKDLLGH